MPAVTGMRKLVVAATLTLLTCSQGLLMEASKVEGHYQYNVATVPLLAEAIKFIISCILLYKQKLVRVSERCDALACNSVFQLRKGDKF